MRNKSIDSIETDQPECLISRVVKTTDRQSVSWSSILQWDAKA